ncbi:unnamed protein product [Scytosiphon promiscuus]
MKTLHASMLSKQPLPLTFLSRLEIRLRGPTSKLITRQQPAAEKTTNMRRVDSAPERKEGSTAGGCLVVSSIVGGGKTDGDRLSSCVRQGASTGSSKAVPAAARALCEAIVELDLAVLEDSNNNSASGRQEQFSALVCSYDCVARGVLLYCEGSSVEDGGGGCSRNLEALRKLVEKATEVNSTLFGKRRSLARLSATRRKLERELQILTDELQAFAKRHKPELATTEDAYERNRVAFLAKRVKIPARVPRLRNWFVPRTLLVEEICDRLGMYSMYSGVVADANADAAADKDEPRLVGLAGPAGCGKSTAASLVIAREDVRGHFHDGVVWLAVGGKGAKRRLPELMLRLANMVYDTVVLNSGGSSRPRPPSKAGVMADRENGIAYGVAYSVAYIRSVMGIGGEAEEGSGGGGGDQQQQQQQKRRRRRPRYLIVADDVHEPEVLQEIKGIGVTVLYTTTRSASGIRGGGADGKDVDLLRLDDLLEEEADTVLRRAVGVKPGVDLPQPARDFMRSYGSVVMDLSYVGRWGVVHGKTDAKSWDMALNRVFIEGGEGGEEWTRRRWHTAVLFAGMADLGRSNVKAKDLYLYLAVLPKGLAFTAADAGALLFGEGCTPDNLQTVASLLASLERRAVLTLEEGGRYCMHSSHADFVRQRISSFPLSRKRALERWRQHVSTAAALFEWPVEDLVDIWCAVAELSGPGVAVERPYDAVLSAMDQSSPASDKFAAVLERVARFHALAEDLPEAHAKYSKLVDMGEAKLSGASNGGASAAASGKLLLVEHLHNLGAIAAALGKAQEAEAAHLRARSLREETLGPHHPDVARSLLALAACASAAGKREDQQRFLHGALTIWGEGPREGSPATKVGRSPLHHFDVAKAMQALGSFALKAGRAREAEGLLRRALAAWEAALGDEHPSTARALHSLGVCAYDGGKLAEAGEFYRRALKIREAKLGPRHPDVAMTLHNLGGCEWKAGRAEEAEALYRQVLSIRIEALGAEHLLVARTLHSLGGCARHAGRDGEATGLYSSALAVRETKLGPSHSEVAATLHEMGVSAFRAKEMERAEEFFRRALVIKEEVAAAKAKTSNAGAAAAAALNTAYTLHDLGGVVFASGGRTEEAEGLFRRALEIRQKQSGDSLAAASTLQCLGECARERSSECRSEDGEGSGSDGDGSQSRRSEELAAANAAAEEAAGFYTRALAIQEEKLGKDHLYVAYTLFQLGLCLLRCGSSSSSGGGGDGGGGGDVVGDGGGDRREEAMAAFTRSLTVRERELGGTHEDVLQTLHYLGACASACGRVSEAEGWYRRAVSAEELTLGADHPSVARTLHMLGACVLRSGKIDEGIALLRRSLEIPEEEEEDDDGEREKEEGVSNKKKLPGQKRLREGEGHHLDVALTLQQLAVCAADAGRTGEADALFREVLAIEEEKLGPEHRDVADTLSNLGECALKSGRTKEATKFYERALEIEEKSFGAEQPVLGSTLHCLGLCAEQDGRAEEAQEYFRRSLAIEEKQMGEDHPHVAATLADLAASSLASGSTEEAEGLLRRALAITEKTTGAETGTLHCLAECTRKRGRHAEAEGLLMRALAIEQGGGGAFASSGGSVFASTSSASGAGAVAATLGELASCACEAGRAEQAEEWFRRALAAEEEKLGEGHRDVAATLTRLGKCLSQQNKVEEAAQVHRRALSIVEETEGDRCLEVTTILLDIGLCALHMGRMEEAEVLYRRAWTIESEHLGPDHPDVLATARALDLFAPQGAMY